MNINSIESLLLKNKNVAGHPQLATALSEYASFVSGGYVPGVSIIEVIKNLAPTSASALASLAVLKSALHSTGLVNSAPVAVADAASTNEDTAIVINVLVNDTDRDGDALTILAATAPNGMGSVTITGNKLVYDPGQDFQSLNNGQSASVTLQYTIKDAFGAVSSSNVVIAIAGVKDLSHFSESYNYMSGGSTVSAILNDINGDGKDDILLSRDSNAELISFLGSTVASVIQNYTFRSSDFIIRQAFGDFNEDGHIDFISTNWFGAAFTINLLNSDGSVLSQTRVPFSNQPHSLAIGDINKDGHTDIALTNFYGGQVTVLAGDGTGSFTSAGSYNAGGIAGDVVLADFNRDSFSDMAVVVENQQMIRVFQGNGSGGFAGFIDLQTGSFPHELHAADVDNDGVTDLLVVNANSNSLWIYSGNGDGSFKSPLVFATVSILEELPQAISTAMV